MTADGLEVGVLDAATDPGPDRVATAVEAAGARPRIGSSRTLTEADLTAIVAVGESAFQSVATAGPTAPVLPVDVAPGVRSVTSTALQSAIDRIVTGATSRERHPVLSIAVDDEHVGVAIREVSLLTAEPARISEFAVRSDAAGHVDEVRADGVVVATPAGSHGYAAAGDGALLAPETGLSIVPVAPFRIDRTRWVVPVADVTADVRRDETPVAVAIDGVERTTAGREPTVSISVADHVETLVVPACSQTFP